MSGNSTDSGSDCIALAIAFFQAPSQFPELLRGEGRLPRGVNELLLVAAGNPRAAGEKPLTPFVHPEKLRETAKFFIEQVLLAHHASHYRIFGVEPDASLAEIKDNHRLLMRLFHPDRQTTEADGATAIATRINQAYTVLRSPEARAAYDFSLQRKHATARKAPTYHPVPRHATAPSGRAFTLPLFVSRHLAPVVLGSFALVAALGVALVYFNRVPASAPGTGERAYKLKPEMALARPEPAAMPLEPPAQYLRSEASTRPPEPPASIAGVMDQPVQTAPTSPPDRQPMPANDYKQPRSEPVGAPSPAPPSAMPGAKPVLAATTKPERIVATVAVNPPEAPETKPPQPRPQQLESLIASFSERYQQGDLEGLLALFDDAARIDRGGDKAQIRNEYGDLFRNSETRTMYIWDMSWKPRGKAVRGNGHYQSRAIGKADRSPRIYGGDITIDVLQLDDRPVIVGLYRRGN